MVGIAARPPDPARGRYTAAIVAMVLAAVVGCAGEAGSAGSAEPTGPSPAVSSPAATPAVVSHEGLPGIEFGDTRSALERDHRLTERPGDCGPQLPAYPGVSPVFDDGRLVLLWAEPPLRTPAGIAVGTPVSAVREAHPDAEELTAPAGTYRFDGLLAVTGDRAYLFLHDGTTVQKLIVGYAEHCRLLFEEGFGTC